MSGNGSVFGSRDWFTNYDWSVVGQSLKTLRETREDATKTGETVIERGSEEYMALVTAIEIMDDVLGHAKQKGFDK